MAETILLIKFAKNILRENRAVGDFPICTNINFDGEFARVGQNRPIHLFCLELRELLSR